MEVQFGETNCYIVECEETKEVMVVDPGGEVDKIIEMINTLKGELKYIFLTHCHGDHIAGVNELRDIMRWKGFNSQK